MHLTVRLSAGPFIWSKWTSELWQFCSHLLVWIKFCKHYSDESVRHSIQIFKYAVPNMLYLCISPSVWPSIHLFGQNCSLNLGIFLVIYSFGPRFVNTTHPNALSSNFLTCCSLYIVVVHQNWRLNFGNFVVIYSFELSFVNTTLTKL